MKKASKRREAVFEYIFLLLCNASSKCNHHMSLAVNPTGHSLMLFFIIQVLQCRRVLYKNIEYIDI